MKYKILYGCVIFAFVVSMTPAQTKLTSSGKCGKPDVHQDIAAGDQTGHLFTLASGKCATKGEVGGAASKEGVFSEYGVVKCDEFVFTTRYDQFRQLLVEARQVAELTQADLAKRLSRPQSFVSKFERGERRLDVIEFLDIAEAIGIDPYKFLSKVAKHPQHRRRKKSAR